MHRRENWPETLNAYIDTLRGAPFAWGVNDCFLFASGAVLAMTGEDPMSEFLNQYSDERGALDLLTTYAVSAADALAKKAAQYGWKKVGISYAQRGDLAVIDPIAVKSGARFGGALGVIMPPWLFAMGPEGLCVTSFKHVLAQEAWHVE